MYPQSIAARDLKPNRSSALKKTLRRFYLPRGLMTESGLVGLCGEESFYTKHPSLAIKGIILNSLKEVNWWHLRRCGTSDWYGLSYIPLNRL